jgi:hypothetical protein
MQTISADLSNSHLDVFAAGQQLERPFHHCVIKGTPFSTLCDLKAALVSGPTRVCAALIVALPNNSIAILDAALTLATGLRNAAGM